MVTHEMGGADVAAATMGLSSPWWIQAIQVPGWIEGIKDWLGVLIVVLTFVLIIYRIIIARIELGRLRETIKKLDVHQDITQVGDDTQP